MLNTIPRAKLHGPALPLPRTLILLCLLAVPISLAAQQGQRYKLIDLGTFGGPNSGVPITFIEINGAAGDQVLSNRGTVTGTADTSTADPFCFLGFDPPLASSRMRSNGKTAC